jgi:hypothetical protein
VPSVICIAASQPATANAAATARSTVRSRRPAPEFRRITTSERTETAAHKFRAAAGDVTGDVRRLRSSIPRVRSLPYPLSPNPYPLLFPLSLSQSTRRREHLLQKFSERAGARERARLVEKVQPIERIDIDALRDAIDKLLVGQS